MENGISTTGESINKICPGSVYKPKEVQYPDGETHAHYMYTGNEEKRFKVITYN
jgi:hypothetical protein